MDSNTVDGRFSNWLLIRRISYKVENTKKTYDSDIFASLNDSPDLEQERKIRHYYLDQRFPDPSCFLPSVVFYKIKSYYQDVNSFALRQNRIVTTDDGEPLVEYIQKNGLGDFEPVWSDSRIQDPAEMFLPRDHKLIVEKVERRQRSILTMREGLSALNFNNNLLCTYGEHLFIGNGNYIEIHLMDTELDKVATDVSVLSLFNSIIYDETGKYETLGPKYNEDKYILTERDFKINFMKICRLQTSDIICACTDIGLVFLIDIQHYIRVNKFKGKVKNERYMGNGTVYDAEPIAVLEVMHSSWSIDIVNIDSSKSIIAIGHNGPAITFFEYSSESGNTKRMRGGEMKTAHNVPCLNFVTEVPDKLGYISLSYVSVNGNVTVVKIKFIGDRLKIQHIDTQFVNEMAWTITSVKRSDFLKVPIFELLNLSFNDIFKQSILSSVAMDTMIMDGELSKPYASDQLGPGTFTTQIPVPTSELSLRCQLGMEGINVPIVELRFTTFDEFGLVNRGILKPAEEHFDNWMVLNERTELRSKERVNLEVEHDPISHFYFNSLENCKSCFSDNDTKRYEKWWNIGFPIKERANSNANRHSDYSFKFSESNTNQNMFRNSAFKRNIKYSDYNEIKKYCNKDVQLMYNVKEPIIGKLSADDLLNKTLIHVETPLNSRSLGCVEAPNRESEGRTLSREDTQETTNGTETTINLTHENVMRDEMEHDIENESDIDSLRSGNDLYDIHGQQGNWNVHNHTSKVKKLMNLISNEPSQDDKTELDLSDLEENFLLVTSESHLFLIKLYPLLIMSFTNDKIFPIESASFCAPYPILYSLNRINFVCFIKELNCIVIASQIGLVSLLRLTEYRGILSFRQEYILGWHAQDPNRPKRDDRCILNSLHREPQSYNCRTDDVSFPFFNIMGMDYTYIPFDETSNSGNYAILYVYVLDDLHRFKISSGKRYSKM